jgi:uncharacterized membrane protein YhaH (DUF805 family)
MNITESIKTCFQKYAIFNGRAKRSEYWYFFLFGFISAVSLSILDMALFPTNENGVLGLIFTLITFIPFISAACRRLHDINRSGWWQMLPYGIMFAGLILSLISETLLAVGIVAGVVAAIILVFWLASPGENSKNRFGSPAK